MSSAILVDNLSKKYIINHQQRESYTTLRDTISDKFKRIFWNNNSDNSFRDSKEDFWALKDISFEVQQGERIGIIGRNGAGKSTLLKILSRITEPTNGRVKIKGTIASLLEVGTGFHPELTGKENIFLNGAILGMSRNDVKNKFDAIVDFAEIEKFLDTPVKRYSSGMYVRLAFAVAAHLEQEILVVDEVLAVGDADFQKKCLGKMADISTKEGRTVLFVSHSMPAIQKLTHKCIVLSKGCIKFAGPTNRAIEFYLNDNNMSVGVIDFTNIRDRTGSGEIRMKRFFIENEEGEVVNTVYSGMRCAFVIEYESTLNTDHRDIAMSIIISQMSGALVANVNTHFMNQNFKLIPPKGQIRFIFSKLPLTAKRYCIDLHLATQGTTNFADVIQNAGIFDVTEGDFYHAGKRCNTDAPVLIDGKWIITGLKREK